MRKLRNGAYVEVATLTAIQTVLKFMDTKDRTELLKAAKGQGGQAAVRKHRVKMTDDMKNVLLCAIKENGTLQDPEG